MKKMMAMAMAAVMVMAAAVPAMAAVLSGDSGTTEVKYSVAGGYTLTIPDAVTFSGAGSKEGDVIVSDALLGADKVLTVTIKSANGYNLVYDTDSTIVYTVTPDGGEAYTGTNAQNVMTVNAGDEEAVTAEGKTVSLTFATTEDAIAAATKSGDHVDTLTFTGSIA